MYTHKNKTEKPYHQYHLHFQHFPPCGRLEIRNIYLLLQISNLKSENLYSSGVLENALNMTSNQSTKSIELLLTSNFDFFSVIAGWQKNALLRILKIKLTSTLSDDQLKNWTGLLFTNLKSIDLMHFKIYVVKLTNLTSFALPFYLWESQTGLFLAWQ